MTDIDRLDGEIIALLQENGRTSNRAIARAIGVSEAAVRKRLRRLTESGWLSYGIVIDTSATNMELLGWVLIEVHPSAVEAALQTISKMACCSAYAVKTGRHNLVANIYARDAADMKRNIEALYAMDRVREVIFRQALSYPIHRYQYVLANSDREELVRWPHPDDDGILATPER